MDGVDIQVLGKIDEWAHEGRRSVLGTIVRTWGSAPRPVGALVAIRDDGQVVGSVSGGCVEDDLVERVGELFRAGARPEKVRYGVSAEEAARFGLPCGGTLRLVREPLRDVAWVEELLARTQRHELVARQLTLSSGVVQLHAAQRGQAMQFDGSVLTTVFGPKWRLLLIGAGQLSQAVARMAQMLDFEVLVCDPREEYAAMLNLDGVTRVPGMPDDVVRALVPDAHTAIVALTHDPKLDDMALMEALQSNAFYVGALGSRRNQATRKQRLAEHFDLQPDELARLHGPVGLAIGAKTPAEIAVSVIAQIVQVKNAVSSAPAAADRPTCATLLPQS